MNKSTKTVIKNFKNPKKILYYSPLLHLNREKLPKEDMNSTTAKIEVTFDYNRT
jgi:hypothetical protein